MVGADEVETVAHQAMTYMPCDMTIVHLESDQFNAPSSYSGRRRGNWCESTCVAPQVSEPQDVNSAEIERQVKEAFGQLGTTDGAIAVPTTANCGISVAQVNLVGLAGPGVVQYYEDADGLWTQKPEVGGGTRKFKVLPRVFFEGDAWTEGETTYRVETIGARVQFIGMGATFNGCSVVSRTDQDGKTLDYLCTGLGIVGSYYYPSRRTSDGPDREQWMMYPSRVSYPHASK